MLTQTACDLHAQAVFFMSPNWNKTIIIKSNSSQHHLFNQIKVKAHDEYHHPKDQSNHS